MTAKVAVLPFEVYSGESMEYLKDTVPKELSSQITGNEQIVVIDHTAVKNLMERKGPINFNEFQLKRISEELDAHFLVWGSLTKISNNLSLDVYIFDSLGDPPFTKDFIEGNELNSLIRGMARKISAKVLLIAGRYPELKEPDVVAKVTPREVEDIKEKRAFEESQAKQETKTRVVSEDQISEDEGKEKEDGTSLPPRAEIEESAEQSNGLKKKSFLSPFASDKPVKITSNSLEADNRRNRAIFKGNVMAKQGDMVIFSDLMTVKYKKKGTISKIEALGSVKMTQRDRIATGGKVVFYNPEQKIVMTGNPRIWQGDNLISCEKVTVLLEENKIFFEGDVDSTIFPERIKESNQESSRQIEAITSPPEPKGGKIVAEEKQESTPEKEVYHGSISEREAIQRFVLEWKRYWESKDLENYMSCYSKEFNSKGMDWHQWKAYKERLNGRYRQISLSLSDPHIALNSNQAMVNFKQYYQSDKYSDYGMKSLTLKKRNGNWLIFGEKWRMLREMAHPSSSTLKSSKPILNKISFRFDGSDIKEESFPLLDEVVETIKKYPQKKAIIEGHTCSLGVKAYNKKLSLKRATSVKNYLIRKGIKANRLMLKAYGEERPIADNETPEGRRMNRRVEIKVIDSQAIAKHIVPP